MTGTEDARVSGETLSPVATLVKTDGKVSGPSHQRLGAERLRGATTIHGAQRQRLSHGPIISIQVRPWVSRTG